MSDPELQRLREQLEAAERAAELRKKLEEAEAELADLRDEPAAGSQPVPDSDNGGDDQPPPTAPPPKGGGKGRKRLRMENVA